MTDDPIFPSPKRSFKPPKRPAGIDLSKAQESKAKAAEALFSKARREGWTRKRFYQEINGLPGYKNLRREIKDNLIDNYRAPNNPHIKKRVPAGYTSRSTLQENLIELVNYVSEDDGIEDDGADYVFVEEDGGYRVYVQPNSP